MENEEAFAAEAQDQAFLSRNSSITMLSRSSSIQAGNDKSSGVRTRTREADIPDDENAPLIQEGRPSAQSRKSYERAINQPWTGAQGSASLPWHKKPSILWLLPIFLPFCIAFGGIIVPKTYLVLDLICHDYLSDKAAKDPSFTFMPIVLGGENPQCRDPHVQSLVANFQLYSSLLAGIFSAIISPHLGALSDRIGRKKIIAFATSGTFLMEVITIIVARSEGQISVYWILLGSLMDGLCGSFTTSMALSFAYASDCTAPDRRNVAFGYFHGTLFAGIALGPVLATYLIEKTGTVIVVFYVAIGCHLFFILSLLFVIPESVSKERQLHAQEKYKIKMQDPKYATWLTTLRSYNIFEPLWILRPRGEGSGPALRRNLFLLASIDTIMFGVAMGTVQIILIYAEYKFGWTAGTASRFISAVNICRVTALVVVLPTITRLVRGPIIKENLAANRHRGSDLLDVNIIRIAVFFDLLGYIGYASAQSGAVMVASGAIASLGGIGSPTLQSSLTKHIPSDRTGQVLGASGLLHAISRIIAPTLFNLIYSLTVGKFTPTVFISLASVFLVAFVFTLFLRPNVYLDEPDHVAPNEGNHREDD